MEPEELYDLKRLLIGSDVPWVFAIEVIIRIFFLYVLIIVSMRLMGQRMASTISRNETAALVSLAAAIGIGLQDPTKGLLPAYIVAMVVLVFQKIIAKSSFRNKKIESITQGSFTTLVENGCLKLQAMSRVGISKERLLGELRAEGIKSLGQVERMYLEAGGGFSILNAQEHKPGLSTVPDWDEDMLKEQTEDEETYVCGRCGTLLQDNHIENSCSNCQHTEWKRAVVK